MKALYYRGSAGGLEWRDDPSPRIEARSDALVRPIAVSTCDLDQAIVHTTVPGAEQPFAIGHEGVGEVVEVGAGIGSVRPGDLVVIPYHLSCGACDRSGRIAPTQVQTAVLPFDTAVEALPTAGFKPVFVREPAHPQ